MEALKKVDLYKLFVSLSSGLIIAFVCFSMVPAAIETATANIFVVAAIMLIGVATSIFLENNPVFFNKLLFREKHKNSGHQYISALSAGVMLHHFSEGIAISGIMGISSSMGLKMTAVILLHFLPETAIVVLIMLHAGISAAKILWLLVLLTAPLFIGAIIGYIFLQNTAGTASIFMSFSAGILLYTACGGILPDNTKQAGSYKLTSFTACFGVILGLLIMAV